MWQIEFFKTLYNQIGINKCNISFMKLLHYGFGKLTQKNRFVLTKNSFKEIFRDFFSNKDI